ncbi:MAG: ABC transporter, partial [Desulfobacula sp.]
MLINIINARTNTFFIDRFSAAQNQAWCILGSNRSGIHDFFRLISGEDIQVSADCFNLPENPGIISFKKQQEIYESELKKDDTDFMDKLDPGTLSREFIEDIKRHGVLIDAFDLRPCMDKGYRELSTGQSRKLMLLSEFSKNRSCLIIEAPYDGLDPLSCKELDQALYHLHRQGILLVLFVCNRSDIPFWCTHTCIISKGKIGLQDTRENVFEFLDRELDNEAPDFKASVQDLDNDRGKGLISPDHKKLVRINQGIARYGGKTIF